MPKASLSEREKAIMKLIMRGMTYPEIATELELGYETVRTHVKRIRNKTGLRRKTSLALWGGKNKDALARPSGRRGTRVSA